MRRPGCFWLFPDILCGWASNLAVSVAITSLETRNPPLKPVSQYSWQPLIDCLPRTVTTNQNVDKHVGCLSDGAYWSAGTLTTNDMSVRTMWLAGQKFDNLQFLNSGALTSSIEGADPLDLVSTPWLPNLYKMHQSLNALNSLFEVPSSADQSVHTSKSSFDVAAWPGVDQASDLLFNTPKPSVQLLIAMPKVCSS